MAIKYISPKGGSAKTKNNSKAFKPTSGAKSSVTGGRGSWSGASGTAGGTGGKTYGGTSAPKGGSAGGVKAPGMTGHTMGKIPGNMMAHSSKTTPFQNTGNHPKGGKLLEVSTANLTSSQAKAPGAAKLDGASKAKLAGSTPYSSANVVSTNSWTGGSGMAGGVGAKTFGRKKG